MLAEERHNAIVDEVCTAGSVKVKELALRFGVTEDCIRKDLTLLEKRGQLKKIYGGAVRMRAHANDYRISDRLGKHIEDKRVIAAKALELINDGDMVFLDMSTSNIVLAQMLADSARKITLVTNCIQVIGAVSSARNIKLIVLGGETNDRRDGFIGALTIEQMERYRFDISFIGAVGVDLENDRVSTYVPQDGSTKHCAISSSKRSYLMLETRKFQEDGTYFFARMSDFTGAIMERSPEEKQAKMLEELNVDWIA